jgi:hypothetical protein
MHELQQSNHQYQEGSGIVSVALLFFLLLLCCALIWYVHGDSCSVRLCLLILHAFLTAITLLLASAASVSATAASVTVVHHHDY